MRFWAISAAGLGLLILTAASHPAAAANAARVDGQASQATQARIVLAQNDTKKKETMTHKVKRKVKTAWRSMTGYKFDVGCPVLVPVNRTTCTQTGKSREDARAKCQSTHVLCSVSDAR
jgi:hypothetical protein